MASDTAPDMATDAAKTMASQVPNYCAHCADPATKLCNACRAIKYCTIECQQADWHMHKSICPSVKKFDEKPRPSNTHYRAILLPKDNSRPHFVWLPTLAADDNQGRLMYYIESHRHKSNEDRGKEHLISIEDLCGPAAPPALRQVLGYDYFVDVITLVSGEYGGGEHLDHSIRMAFRDDFRMDAHKQPNPVLENLTHHAKGEPWCGDILIHGMDKTLEEGTCKDLGPSDLTIAVCSLLDSTDMRKYWRIGHTILEKFCPPSERPPKKFKCVKVVSKEDGEGHATFHYEQVDVPRRHPVTRAGKESRITKSMGIPVQYWQAGGARPPAASTSFSTAPGMPTSNLSIIVEPSACGAASTNSKSGDEALKFGDIPQDAMQSTATTLVARCDQKPLSVSLVDAICSYIATVAQPKMQSVAEIPVAQSAALKEIKTGWVARGQSLIQELEDMGLDDDSSNQQDGGAGTRAENMVRAIFREKFRCV